MKYLYDLNIIHRDLKPGNILLNDNYEPLICDFGISKFEHFNLTQTQGCLMGTVYYMAPESIEENIYNKKTDVYSFGIIMYEIITGLSPFAEAKKSKMSIYKFKDEIKNGYRPEFACPIKDYFRDLIKHCWSGNPDERPSFEQLFYKLAFNDDILQISDSDKSKYYLDGIDTNNLLLYAKKIYNLDENIQDKYLVSIKKLETENSELKKSVSYLEEKLIETSNFLKSQCDSYTEKILSLDKITLLLVNENQELKKKVSQLENKIANIDDKSIDNEKKLEDILLSNDSENENDIFTQIKVDEIKHNKNIKIPFANPKDDSEIFYGIINFLTKKFDGNIYEKGVIKITSNITYSNDYKPKNVLDFNNYSYFCSKDQENCRINFNFKEKSILLTSYSIKSCATRDITIYPYLKSWVIEGSNDGKDWILIHKIENTELLYGRLKKANFEVECNSYYHIIRLRSIGESWYNRGNKFMIGISMIEFFGTLQVQSFDE